MSPYPLGLILSGRRVLVVGGGTVATRRIPALVDAGAEVVLVSPEVTPALRSYADTGRLQWIERGFEVSDVDGCWLIHVAVDDPVAAAAVSAAADERRIFCVRADDRHAATAWTPATTRQGPVTVAVTAGGDPLRAMAVRDAIRSFLESSAPRANRVAPLSSGRQESHSIGPDAGRVALVGGGPGDPELITVKGRRLLAEADVVVIDRLAPGLLLDELRPEVELIDASKLPYGPARAQDEINALLVDRARAGHFVVRLKGGDPFVFGRGGEEVLACVEAGVAVTVVPGVTSAVAAPAAAGIPVTHRGVAHEFVVVSGHVPPDHPDSLIDWPALATLRGTVCVLMGLKNLLVIAATLIAHGKDPATPVAIVRDGTLADQDTTRGTLGNLPPAPRPPAVIVIGDVVAVLPPSADRAEQ